MERVDQRGHRRIISRPRQDPPRPARAVATGPACRASSRLQVTAYMSTPHVSHTSIVPRADIRFRRCSGHTRVAVPARRPTKREDRAITSRRADPVVFLQERALDVRRGPARAARRAASSSSTSARACSIVARSASCCASSSRQRPLPRLRRGAQLDEAPRNRLERAFLLGQDAARLLDLRDSGRRLPHPLHRSRAAPRCARAAACAGRSAFADRAALFSSASTASRAR